jgi:hypothetical protein
MDLIKVFETKRALIVNASNEIAHQAARLVACGDMTRPEAIRAVTQWHRAEAAANGDVTGVASIENRFPSPSTAAPEAKVAAIASDLLDDAQDAADMCRTERRTEMGNGKPVS